MIWNRFLNIQFNFIYDSKVTYLVPITFLELLLRVGSAESKKI